MKDIKELAQRAGFGGQQRNTLSVKLELFAKYVIAAYIAAQKPVAWKDTMTTEYADGIVEHQPMLHGYKGWESLPNGSDLFAAPPLTEPAPECKHEFVTTFGGDYCIKCNVPAPSNDFPAAAPSSEEVRDNVRWLREAEFGAMQEYAARTADLIATLEQRVAELENVISEHGADMWAQGEEYAVLSAKCAQAQIKADALEQQVAALTMERDEDALLQPRITMSNLEMASALAAAQAREAKRLKTISDEATAIAFYGDQPPQWMLNLIALPTDDSALMERLAQERERCAEVAEDTAAGRDAEAIAEAIRRMT